MYLLGLSGFRMRRRGTMGLAAILGDGRGVELCKVDRIEGVPELWELRARANIRRGSGVPWMLLCCNALVLGTEERLRCVKLTPRFAMLLDLTATGGLLGQCELAKDDRDTDLRFAPRDFWDGVLRLDEPLDMIPELCLLEFRKA